MREIKVKIQSCTECPYCQYDGGYGGGYGAWTCEHQEGCVCVVEYERKNIAGIPEGCPLPEVDK